MLSQVWWSHAKVHLNNLGMFCKCFFDNMKCSSQFTCVNEGLDGGGGGGVWYSLFIKNLAHYSSHKNFGLFVKIRPTIH